MSAFVVEQFGGIAPKLDPRRVANSVAQVADNCLLSAGALEPLPGMVDAGDLVAAATRTMYPYNNSWLTYTRDVDIVEVPIANDVSGRIVITDATSYPKVYAAGASYRLGMPAPVGIPSAVAAQVPVDPNGIDAETISYVVTLVDAWGVEGPPSTPSLSIDRVRDTDVTVTLPAAATGNYNFGAGALKRIYRSNTGTAGAQYQFVGEVTIGVGTFLDTTLNEQLGEILPSSTWVGPPDDNTTLYPNGPMVGVIATPNGFLAGFSHKTLCLSEPFLYHAWPFEYRITFEDVIVGIASIAAGILVTTTRKPYIVTGVSPAAMVVVPLEINQACVSKRGVVDMGDYAIFPSPDGLVAISGNQAQLLTQEIFTREQWQAFKPETIHAYEHEGRYIGFVDLGGFKTGFIFDPVGAFINVGAWVGAGYYDAFTDTLFVNHNGVVRKWGQNFDNPTPYQWMSKKHVSLKPNCFSIVRVLTWNDPADDPVTVKIWADGDLKATITIDNKATPFARLPGGFVAKIWELELTGTNPVSHAGLFDSFADVV